MNKNIKGSREKLSLDNQSVTHRRMSRKIIFWVYGKEVSSAICTGTIDEAKHQFCKRHNLPPEAVRVERKGTF